MPLAEPSIFLSPPTPIKFGVGWTDGAELQRHLASCRRHQRSIPKGGPASCSYLNQLSPASLSHPASLLATLASASSPFATQCAFPYDGTPSQFCKHVQVMRITHPIPLNLYQPELAIGCWKPKESAIVAVPKTSVYKHNCFMAGKDHIGLSGRSF